MASVIFGKTRSDEEPGVDVVWLELHATTARLRHEARSKFLKEFGMSVSPSFAARGARVMLRLVGYIPGLDRDWAARPPNLNNILSIFWLDPP